MQMNENEQPDELTWFRPKGTSQYRNLWLLWFSVQILLLTDNDKLNKYMLVKPNTSCEEMTWTSTYIHLPFKELY